MRNWKHSPRLAALLLLPAFFPPGWAQAPGVDTQAELRKKIEDLERSLADVKAEFARVSQAPPPAAPAEPPPPPAPAAAAEEADAHSLGPLKFRGYSDFTYGRPFFSQLPPGGLRGSTESFSLGDFDLFATARLGAHLSVLSEIFITSDFSNSFAAEVDRLMLTYSVNDYLKVTAGKFNTAIGYYDNAFHRARYFQTATGRPLMYADEDDGGILPVHGVGVSAIGLIPSGHLGLHWIAEAVNGRSYDPEATPAQNFVDANNGKAVNFALYARPAAVPGLQIGGSFYRDRLHPAGLAAVNQRIYSGYVALVRPHLELVGEGVLLQHELPSWNRTWNTTSAYAQASRQYGRLRPYCRYDYQNVPALDPVLGSVGRRNGPSFGTRLELSDFVNFKLQYGRLGYRGGPSTNDAQAQLAFVF